MAKEKKVLNYYKSIRERRFMIIALVLLMLLVTGCQQESSLSDRMIQTIDHNSDVNGDYDISVKEITSFKWDKMVIFQVGGSDEEISNALGVKFPYQTEHPANLQIFIEKNAKASNCVAFSYDNAVLEGSKKELDGVTYYSISAKIK
jgi:hypothetical protein